MSGLVATLVASPIDVIKTRVMNASASANAGVISTTMKTFENEVCSPPLVSQHCVGSLPLIHTLHVITPSQHGVDSS
jgi:hypothetical protein